MEKNLRNEVRWATVTILIIMLVITFFTWKDHKEILDHVCPMHDKFCPLIKNNEVHE